jgi:hypothetical protein
MKRLLRLFVVLFVLLAFSLPINVSAETVVTWDPNNKAGVINLSDDNLTVSSYNGTRYSSNITTTDSGYSSGKYYWELTTSDNDCNIGNNDCWFGIKNALSKISDDMIGYGYISPYDNIPKSDKIDAKSTIGILLDLDNHVLNIQTNQGIQKEIQLTSGITYRPAVAITGNELKVTANFGATPFKYTMPDGYLPYDRSAISLPTAPSNLVAIKSDISADIILNWNAVDGAASYNIKRSETVGGPYMTISTVTGSALTFNDKGLKYGKTYYYVVSAVDGSGESANSNEASATLTAPVNVLKLVLEVKEQKQISVSDELGKNTDMTWISSDLSIATVDANGLIKALKPGNTVITCTSKDGEYIESIKVLVVDLDLQLAVDLQIGDSCRLTVDDLKNTTSVIWASYDISIVTVSSKGKVTAIGEGLTYITATDGEGKEIGRIYIRVRQ